MRLKAKLIIIALVPLLLLSIILGVFVSGKAETSLKKEITEALQSTTYALRDAIALKEGNNFYIENDTLFNGADYNVTADTETVDKILKETGIYCTIFYGNTRYLTSVPKEGGVVVNGTARAILTTAGDAVVNTVVKEAKEYTAENVDVAGMPCLAYYIPLYNADSSTPVGMVFAGKAQNNVDDVVGSIRNGVILVALILVIVATVVVFFVADAISKRLGYGTKVLAQVADGDLTVEIDNSIASKKDETGDIARSVGDLKDKLVSIVSDIATKSNDVHECAVTLGDASEESAGTVEQVERAVNEIAEGATSQAADTTNATEKVIVMGNLVEQTNENVDKLNAVSDKMEENGKAASGTLVKLEDINEKARGAIDVIYNQTNTTNESAKKISEAVSLITSIAEETNLLSLNASIEAARAGEQGRGFAVVASQISKLAEQSNESAKKIEEIITSLMEDSEKAVATMDEVKVIMNEQSEMVEETSATFGEVLKGIGESRSNIMDIASNMKELNASRESVTDIVSNLSAIAEENAASTEETSASTTEVSATIQEISANAAHLKGIADELYTAVNTFKLS